MSVQMSTLNMADGTALTTYQWLPQTAAPKGVIVIVHGYGEHAGRYEHVAAYFNKIGYALYAADHRGHGRSRGERLGYFASFEPLSDDLTQVIGWAHAQHAGLPLYLLGHSLGGLLTLYHEIKSPSSSISGVILSDPALTPSVSVPPLQKTLVQFLNRIAPTLKVVPRVASTALSRDASVGTAYDADPNVYHEAISARVGVEVVNASDLVYANAFKFTLPLLMLIGTADQIAKPEHGLYVYDHVGSADKTLKKYEGFYHELLNEPEKEQIMGEIAAWLAKH